MISEEIKRPLVDKLCQIVLGLFDCYLRKKPLKKNKEVVNF